MVRWVLLRFCWLGVYNKLVTTLGELTPVVLNMGFINELRGGGHTRMRNMKTYYINYHSIADSKKAIDTESQ